MELLAEQIMSHDLSIATKLATIEVGEALATACHIRHMPVINESSELVGIVSIRDVLKAYVQNESRPAVSVTEIMTPEPITVSSGTPVAEVAQLMIEHDISCVPVKDENGSLIGIISERDFLKCLK